MALNLKSLFFAKSSSLLGLDISSSSVKFVEISFSGARPKLERYAIEILPKGAIVDGHIDNMEAVSAAVERGWKKIGTKIKQVAMALPTSAVITKKIYLPKGLSEQEYEFQVESEANQYIPFPLDEVSLDFQILGASPGSPDDVEVLIAASRKEMLEDRVALAEAAGLKPMVVDVDSFAVRAVVERFCQQLEGQAKDQIIDVFDIGANVTRASVFRNAESIYDREQAFGGAQLTQDISRAYGMTFEEADVNKRNATLPDNYSTELLRPFIESTVLEITRGLQFFFTSTPYSRVDMILLGGGCAVLEGLADAVSSRTQTQAVVLNPFKGMELSDKVREKQLKFDAPALMVAAGLAMRKFES